MEFGKCQSVMVGTFQLVRQNLTSTSTTPQIFFVLWKKKGSLAVWPSHVSSVAELSPILNGKSGCTSCLLATACGLFLGLATHVRLGHRVYSYLAHKLSPIFADLSPILKEAKVVNLINRHKNNQLMMGMSMKK